MGSFFGTRGQLIHTTKSFGSVLVDIAVDEGLIPGAEESVERYFKDQTSAWGDRAGAVIIKSLLTMTYGLDCDDHGDDFFKCEWEMHRAEDWVNFALGLPMIHTPGKHWAYNSATLIPLSEIITQTSGLSVPQFAERYLFEPLGIKEFKWCFSPKGRAWMAGSANVCNRWNCTISLKDKKPAEITAGCSFGGDAGN